MSLLQPISRKQLFQSSLFVDNFIAESQQSWGELVTRTHRLRHFDHCSPFQASAPATEETSVLALPAQSRQLYRKSMPSSITALGNQLAITSWYLMGLDNRSILEFPFEHLKNRNLLRKAGMSNDAGFAYEMNSEAIPAVVSHLLFSRHQGMPFLFMLPAAGSLPLAVWICDDGNLHTQHLRSDKNRIVDAAKAAGFSTGDITLCSQVSICTLPNMPAT